MYILFCNWVKCSTIVVNYIIECEHLNLHLQLTRPFPSRVESVEELKHEQCALRCLSSLTTADPQDQSRPKAETLCYLFSVELSPL